MSPPAPDRRARLTALLVTAVYGAVVVWAAAQHEPWRDEVVPLSIVRHAGSFGDLVAALRFEGHPLLWYLLLSGLDAVVGATWVLKAASVGSAIAAVYLLNRSPLPWWLRVLVTFSFFPLYQYSVVSRGYSLEMLWLFAFCALFPGRHRHPVALVLVLAGLANTEVFGFIMAVAAAVMLAVEWAAGGSAWGLAPARARRLAVGIYLAGLGLAVAVAYPAAEHPLAASAGASALGAVARASARPAGHVERFAILPYASLWLWAYFVYLAPRPSVLAFAVVAFVGIETFFLAVYGPGALWHLGNVVLVLVAVMWLDAHGSPPARALPAGLAGARRWLGRALAVVVVVLFARQTIMGYRDLSLDARHDYSANRAFAALLHDDPTLANAVVMGEPDAPLWSLPYYTDHRIYLPREGVFRPWGMFRPGRARAFDLEGLLAAARRVRDDCRCPVVITSGWPLEPGGTLVSGRGTYAEEQFKITTPARDDFVAATRHVARLGPTITDENYDVYVLR